MYNKYVRRQFNICTIYSYTEACIKAGYNSLHSGLLPCKLNVYTRCTLYIGTYILVALPHRYYSHIIAHYAVKLTGNCFFY
jgi:disulfide bond formation protein DsbB